MFDASQLQLARYMGIETHVVHKEHFSEMLQLARYMGIETWCICKIFFEGLLLQLARYMGIETFYPLTIKSIAFCCNPLAIWVLKLSHNCKLFAVLKLQLARYMGIETRWQPSSRHRRGVATRSLYGY